MCDVLQAQKHATALLAWWRVELLEPAVKTIHVTRDRPNFPNWDRGSSRRDGKERTGLEEGKKDIDSGVLVQSYIYLLTACNNQKGPLFPPLCTFLSPMLTTNPNNIDVLAQVRTYGGVTSSVVHLSDTTKPFLYSHPLLVT